ncbi:MAG: SDR family NAD(P)-dependent oxidoreductase [Acidobacteriia bacterium]|nr:SDR family NAD(P)-dependent oxidoreductase [Terriglobia bacterium]
METNAIAVVGMAGRFPGARNVGEFWNNLRGAVESVRALSDQELRAAGASPDLLRDPNYIKAGAVLEDIELFDASFFGFSPKDAAIMDPQHRHFLECAWEALEHAGHVPDTFKGSIGVYAGSGMSAYMLYNLLTNRELVESAGLFLIRQTGNDKDVLATRVSYQLNLRGPSINIQTACSTSLVAIHMACQSLLNHECDMALAGGVTIEIPHGLGYMYREGEILSQDGHCRAFDARSTGTIFGSGAGVVVLRRLRDALRDGDAIHAVIKGSAINNDGSRKVGYLAPSVDGQAEVITEALAVAGLDAASISYVETHGTGTRVGDPIEISALTQAFRQSTQAKGYCAIGSVKTNIGHLDSAAGVAGFIKTVLALKGRQLPPSLHFEKPNPLIDFANSPFYVNAQLREWEAHGAVRRAAVTSLGIGGTNAHVILEEAPETARAGRSRPRQLVVLSAKSASALDTMSSNLASYIASHRELNLADISFTCQLGRKEFRHRRMLVCGSVQEAREALVSRDSGSASVADGAGRSIAFLFSGQGSQYVDMARELYDREPVFREHVDLCAELLSPSLGLDLRTLVYPAKEEADRASQQINQTGITQPALFVIEYALAKLWMSWGIRPKAMAGHSIGEYVAACLAGVFSLEDALAIVAIRGRLMQGLQPGAMTAVSLAEHELLPSLGEGLAIAAINGPRQCVVSGPAPAIGELEKDLSRRDIPHRRLHTSHAFHSAMVDPILKPFAEAMRRFTLKDPQIPYLSNLTGTWVRAADARDPEYWVKHLRGTVRFADGLDELFRDPGLLLLEVGPGTALASLAKQHPQKPKQQKVFQSLRHVQEQDSDYQVLLNTLGRLWIEGAQVDWAAFREPDAGYRVPLPTYPFERQRHWIEPGSHAFGAVTQPAMSVAADWFYDVTWKRAPLGPVAQPVSTSRWLIFSDSPLGTRLQERLVASGQQVVTVKRGTHFARLEDGKYLLNPARREDYDALVADLVSRDSVPQKILHLWAVSAPTGLDSIEEAENLCFYSLLFLAQAFGERDIGQFRLAVVSSGMQPVNGEAVLHPESAMLLGPCKLIPKEFPGIACQNIDIALPHESAPEQILEELAEPRIESTVAYRGRERWVPAFARERSTAVPARSRLRENGVYLITGGLGSIGMVVADCLAKKFHARLVLTGHTALPPREHWESFLGTHDADDPICWKIRKVRELEKAGSEVLVAAADVANYEQMREVIAQTRERFGTLHGVFHAAGVLDDGLIQLKARDSAQRVLEPKVKGTLVLDRLLADASLDFLVLFSSISALVPPVGQVDYAAANAFLNAFAQARAASNGRLTVAVSWSLWSDAGLAAGALDQNGSTAQGHPVLGGRMSDNLHETIYSGRYRWDTHWVFKEHRFRGGEALFPGTGYLEMATAAVDGSSLPIELRDVFFLAPLTLGSAESREIRLLLQRNQQGSRFSVIAKPADGAQWEEYAFGQARHPVGEVAETFKLNEISARCNSREIHFANQRTKQEKYFEFGPRWRNLKQIRVGKNEALSVLELAEEFRGDLETCRIHPALFDLATGSALYLIPGYESSDDLYLPFSYEKLTIWDRLPAVCYSHIRPRGGNEQQGIVIFDITVMNAAGRALIDIEGFAVRRINDPGALLAGNVRKNGSSHSGMAFSSEASLLDRRLEEGISSEQGSEALLRILSTDGIGPHVIVSRLNPERLSVLAKPPDRAPRSDPANAGTAPRDEMENALAGWWAELLGADGVGVHDDFFELGGHSLVAVRLFAKIKKAYDVDLGLATLFEARTIEKLANVVRAARKTAEVGPKPWSSLVPIQPQGSRPPIYFVGGWGGNVLTFETIARYMGQDQPVYGLQPQGLDGKQPFLTRMEDIGSSYLPAIRSVQPHGPYYLGGYSFGGLVAFEVAQQLQAQGEEVALVAFIDTIEWRYWQRPPTPLERLELYRLRVKKLFFQPGGMEYLKGRLRAKGLRTRNRVYSMIGRPIPVPLSTIVEANRFAAANYVPRVYPGRITLLRCAERDVRDRDDYFLGWGGLADGGVDVVDVPGHHLTIAKEPNVRVLAEKLRYCIDKALAGKSAESEIEALSQR